MGLMSVGGENGSMFLGYMEATVRKGTQYHDSNTEYFSNKTFLKKCKVRIVGHTYSEAGAGMSGINVNLSGVGHLIDANSTGNMKIINNIYSVSPGQTLTANASASYNGAAGYVVYLVK